MTALSALFNAVFFSAVFLVSPAHADQPQDQPAVQPAEARPTMVVAGLTLRVDDRDAAADAAVDVAVQAGGWFSRYSPQAVTLRVPVDQVQPALAALRQLGELVDRSYQSDDLGETMLGLETRLAARRKMLQRYLAVLDNASPKAVVSVQRQTSQLVSEIEGLEGQLRLLRDQAAYAAIDVSFRYRERQGPVRDGSSSFAWLNTLNLADLLDDMESGRRASRSACQAVAPTGFAPFHGARRFQAVSPDGVAYRVRSVRNQPRSDLAFWREALKNRMEGAGYHVEADQDVLSADGSPGVLLELGAANGEQDQTYLVGLFVDGARLVIVEATGRADRFAQRRDAVLAAVRGITL
ncbi:MAG: DUF4349 domain-containing protein [Oligoflexia bacterium]|nr:DUF4349 domain-containing protein [Oligoflexia bacterium]